MTLSAILRPHDGFIYEFFNHFFKTDRFQDYVRERHDLQQAGYNLLQGCEEASPLWNEDLEPCELTCSDTCMLLCTVDTRGHWCTSLQ